MKVILDLCGGTGAWSKPYKDNGYDVRTITLPNYDLLETVFEPETFEFRGVKMMRVAKDEVYGILAAPPCTMFSFARTKAKTPRDLEEGMKCVRMCLDIIWSCMEITQSTGKKTLPLKFWALENPARGFLPKLLGKPAFVFNPYDFGDNYKKETALWGNFKEPVKWCEADIKKLPKFDYMKSKDIHPEKFGQLTRQERRSITPEGFAKAFYKENK